jgi:hypothetical protein
MNIPANHVSSNMPIFDVEAQIIAAYISKRTESDLSAWMKISEKLAKETKINFTKFGSKDAVKHSALLSYSGDVYSGLNAGNFNAADWKYAERNIRILSGLYGYLKPNDGILPYRLEMAASSVHSTLKSLYTFWSPKITTALQNDLNENKEKVLINLCSDEYFKVIGKDLNAKIIHVHFREKKDGNIKFISTNAKKARGLMARYMVKNKINVAEGLKGFDYEKYGFSKKLSTENEWYFIR